MNGYDSLTRCHVFMCSMDGWVWIGWFIWGLISFLGVDRDGCRLRIYFNCFACRRLLGFSLFI